MKLFSECKMRKYAPVIAHIHTYHRYVPLYRNLYRAQSRLGTNRYARSKNKHNENYLPGNTSSKWSSAEISEWEEEEGRIKSRGWQQQRDEVGDMPKRICERGETPQQEENSQVAGGRQEKTANYRTNAKDTTK